jgi:hypothetical protein
MLDYGGVKFREYHEARRHEASDRSVQPCTGLLLCPVQVARMQGDLPGFHVTPQKHGRPGWSLRRCGAAVVAPTAQMWPFAVTMEERL